MRRIAKTILDKENLAKAKEDLTKEKTWRNIHAGPRWWALSISSTKRTVNPKHPTKVQRISPNKINKLSNNPLSSKKKKTKV